VVAVSGGADSVALLRALAAFRTGPLTVAHVNHRLRGAESDADETFVRELAAGLGFECRAKSADVAALGGNLESTARRVRYEFFAEVAAEVGATWVATGHTVDDQAETVLHRIVRGTGIQGLRGIAHVQQSPPTAVGGLWIFRPLLAVTRADILEYLAELGQPFREDSSNADPRFTRNRIRHELLPLLRTFNPEIGAALARLARQAAEASDVMSDAANRLLADCELPPAGRVVVLRAEPLAAAHPALVREYLRRLWDRAAWSASDMNADHWLTAAAVARGEATAADLPGGIHIRHAGRVVQIGPRE
jgi:tRNA(Ile)-lysidine synthase